MAKFILISTSLQMPRFSHRQQVLRALDTFILLHSTSRADLDGISSTLTQPLIPFFFTALTLLSTSLPADEDSPSYGHEACVIILDFMMMTLSMMTNQSQHLLRKRKSAEDDLMLSGLLCVRSQAYKRRYIVPRIRRAPALSKADTFNAWFNETDRTWITVVGLLVL